MTDLTFFDCEKQRARLSTAGCSKMWRKANQPDGDYRPQPFDSLFKCVACSLGAQHAGDKGVIFGFSELLQDIRRYCPRCQRLAPRLINGLHCVSCYNRAREVRIGANAKGHRPVSLPARLRRLAVVVSELGKPPRVVSRTVVDLEELVILIAQRAAGPILISRPTISAAAFAAGGVSPAAAVIEDLEPAKKPPTKPKPSPPASPGPGYLTSKQAAELTGVPIDTLYSRMKQLGAPPWQKVGHRIFVERAAFLAWDGARRGAAVQGEAVG